MEGGRRSLTQRRARPALAGIISLLFAILIPLACSGGEATRPKAESIAIPPPDPTAELSVGVISTDLSRGPNEVKFFLLDSDSQPVSTAEVDVSTFYPGGEPNEVTRARFRRWPLGDVGIYTTQVKFDRSGAWEMRVSVTGPDGLTRSAETSFEVKEESSTPGIGSPAPPSRNKTIRDAGKLEELTTARPPDPELYNMTIADGVASGKPFVVVFAMPALCQTATCGPQVQVVEGIKDRYKDSANFIHVEVFDNPHEIQGDLSRAKTAAAVEEWGLPTEPWIFIVDRHGRVAAKFEAFTSAEEIEDELRKVLQ